MTQEQTRQKRIEAIFMFTTLARAAEGFGWFLKDITNHRAKMVLNDYLAAARRLDKALRDQYWSPEQMDDFDEDAATFSMCLECITKAATEEKKQELLQLMKAYLEGELIVKDINEPNAEN